MKKPVLLLLLNVVLFFPSFSQDAIEETFREIFLDGEFFLVQEEYIDALSLYNRIYTRGYQDNANINYRMGICYLNIPGQKDKSIEYLLKACQKADDSYKEGVFKQDKAPLDAYVYLGNAYRINNQLEDAIKTYEKYKTLIGNKKDDERKYADQQIQACLNAKEMQKTPAEISFTNLGNNINSGSSNYSPVVSGDGSTLIYMFELPFYDAVYYCIKENGSWSEPRNITPEIQSDGDLFSRGLSYDGKTMLLTKEDEFNSDIWISKLKEDGTWEVARPLNKSINTKFWESYASLSPDGKILYFASNRSGGYGEMDLYMSRLDESNDWDEPINLGKTLNTELNEDCPVMASDGKTMFFSSQGHKCIGGYDIFYSTIDAKGNWSEPVNIGYPLNTTDNETFYYPVNKSNGYLARMGDDSYGKEDIYMVKIRAYEEIDKVVEEFVLTEEKIQKTEEKTEIEETSAEEIATETKQAEPKIVTTETEKEMVESEVEIREEKPTEPIKKPVKIEVKMVLFAFNSVTLTETDKRNLVPVVNLLKEAPSAKIILNGYTDSKGPEEINRIISQQRADAVKEYLMGKEIGLSRIKSIGHGMTDYIAINQNNDGSDNSEGRKFNRRVEIELEGIDENYQIIQIDLVPDNLKYNK